jgi:hypothetical protein
LKSNFFYSLQLLRNLKTLAENDGNQHFEFIHYFNFNEVLDDMKKLSKQITENAQTGEANTKKFQLLFQTTFLTVE